MKKISYILYVISFILFCSLVNVGVKYLSKNKIHSIFDNNKDSKDLIIGYVNDINKQAPIKIDSITIFVCMSYLDNTIQYSFEVRNDIIPYIDKNDFKNTCMNNLIKSGGKEFVSYVVNNNILINYAIYDSDKKLQFIIKIDPNDLRKKTLNAKRGLNFNNVNFVNK